MINYNWDCKTVDAYPQFEGHTNLVYKVHWIVKGISDELKPDGEYYSSTTTGTQTLDTKNITDFIPFENLTNEQVVAWTKGAMGNYQVNSIEDKIENRINSLITPASITLIIT